MTRFCLRDLVISVACAALILAMTIVARQNVQSAEDIAGCASRLKRIYDALTQYQLDTGSFPRTIHDPTAPLTAYTGVLDERTIQPNDVTASAFLLVRRYQLPAMTFTCPAALRNGLAERDDFDPVHLGNRGNFKARMCYNYSLINMYPSEQALLQGYDLRKLLTDSVIASDTNPGHEQTWPASARMDIRQIRIANSPNHQRDGQNLLWGNGSVEFSGTPFIRKGTENVFASMGNFPDPGSPADIVLVPVWSMGPDLTPRAVTLRRWVFVLATVFSTGMIAGIVIRSVRKTRQNRSE